MKKVMESHGISNAQKTTNPGRVQNVLTGSKNLSMGFELFWPEMEGIF